MAHETKNVAEEIDNEPVSIGRVYTEELVSNPDVIQEKLNAKVHAMLAKYGYGFEIRGFQWQSNGRVLADVVIAKLPNVATS